MASPTHIWKVPEIIIRGLVTEIRDILAPDNIQKLWIQYLQLIAFPRPWEMLLP